jgi:hypothetical protein
MRVRAAVVVALMLLAVLGLPAPAQAAGIALVQKSPEATDSGDSITATLPAGSRAGNLLVATTTDVNAGCASDDFTAPAGWVAAASVCRGTTGPLVIWYRANAPAGTTSVTFGTGSTGANSRAQVSEWSGVAAVNPLDQTGTLSSASASTNLTVTTAGNVAASGELAVTGFATSAGLSTFTPGTGWSSLSNDPVDGFDSDYRIAPPSGAQLTESATSSPQTVWAAAIATFRPACAGGSRTVKTAPSLAFPSVTLNAYNRTSTKSATVTVDDETGTASGWNLTATSTRFALSSGQVLPATATQITGAAAVAGTGNCSLPTNSVSYPVTLPAGSTPPTAARIYNAGLNTGQGPVDITLTTTIQVPANAAAGTYSSTWTLTMASGP